MTVHIHAPPAINFRIVWQDCPDCKKRSPLVCLVYEWYAGIWCCMRCGREYNEDGWVRAPLMRGWREQNKNNMRRAFKRAAVCKPDAQGTKA